MQAMFGQKIRFGNTNNTSLNFETHKKHKNI